MGSTIITLDNLVMLLSDPGRCLVLTGFLLLGETDLLSVSGVEVFSSSSCCHSGLRLISSGSLEAVPEEHSEGVFQKKDI